MTLRTVRFDDFSRGEFGDLGPRLSTDLGPGWFTGKNVMKYRNGAVGPRPGLRQWTRNGTWPDGVLHAMQPSSNATELTGVLIGTKPKLINRSFSLLELGIVVEFDDDDIPEPTTWPTVGQHRTDGDWFLVPDDGLYKADHALDTVVPVAGAAGLDGRAFRFYRDRQLLSDGATTYYSGPGTAGWDSFDDFFTGSSFNPVAGFFPLRNGIVIPQATPNLDYVTGTIGTGSEVLRQVSSRTGPLDPYGCASIGTEFLVMMGRGLPYPMLYNGAVWEELRHLPYAGPAGSTTSQTNGAVPAHHVVDLEYDQAWMILSGLTAAGAENRMLLDWDSCRSYHTWEVEVSPFARRYENGLVMLSDGGDVSAPPEFYAWFPELDRPGFVDDDYSRPGDVSDTPLDAYLHMPASPAPQGKEWMVKAAIVDFRKWDTGAEETNHFDVTVDAIRRYGYGAPVTSAVQTFDEAGSTAVPEGVDARVHLGFGDQGWGGEFQLKVDNLRGCAIRSIEVIIEERDARV